MSRLMFSAALGALLLAIPFSRADVPLPGNVLDPATLPEAWNVIGFATRNLERLLAEKRADELALQVSLCSPSLRTLVRLATSNEAKSRLDALTVRAFVSINETAAGGIAADLPRAQAGYGRLREVLDEMAGLFDAQTVKAQIFYCPTHPEVVSTDDQTPCGQCRERLVPRQIPYSFIYTAPPEPPTLRATATADAPLQAGRMATVKMTLAHPDGRPVVPRDLLVEHTQFIHLLLVDPSRSDFQRQHPQPTGTPGEYTFSFTPGVTAPYRLWVDVVPAATGLAEFPMLELPSAGTGAPVAALEADLAGTADGLRFQITFTDRNGMTPRARETRMMRMTFTEANGEPMKRLGRYLNAYAHLTGFYDDDHTIVRLHPEGGPVLRDDFRGGPSLGFRFYPPKAGRIRFFCEVLVDGKRTVAPVDVTVSP